MRFKREKLKENERKYLLGAKKGTHGGYSKGLLEGIDTNISETCSEPRTWLICIVDENFYKSK